MKDKSITIKTKSGLIIELTAEQYNNLKDYTLEEILDKFQVEDTE